VTRGFQQPRSPVGGSARRQAATAARGAGGASARTGGAVDGGADARAGGARWAAGATEAAARDGGRSYYGRPVIKQPVWTWEIPLYFITGGVAGASSGLAFAAGMCGNRELSERAQLAALGGVSISPLLLISDLGRPARFLNMLRMFKFSSPMSVGSWLLAANGAAISLAGAGTLMRRAPALTRAAQGVAAVLGLPLTTYTAVLIANTSIPIWHEGRRELPFVFGGSSAAGAGALAALITSPERAGQARRLAIIGAVIEGASTQVMERRLGELAEPLRRGRGGALSWAAKTLVAGGAALIGYAGGRRRTEARAGAAMVLAGEALQRLAIFRAGFQSARDPRHTVGPQRRRIESGESRGMARR
jgi:DMSO reductase anchor subunit